MTIITFEEAINMSYAYDDNFCLSRDNWVHVEPIHMHDFYELSYTYQGEGVHVINGVAYPVKSGTLILFSKMDNHSFYSVNNFSMINCCFKSTSDFRRFPIDEETLIVSLNREQSKEVDAILKVIEVELNLKDSDYKQIVSSSIDTVFAIMNRYKLNRITTDPIWSDLLAFVLENYQTVTLQDALNIMGMSKSYFCRKFKKQFSVSFLTYVNRLRIQHSHRLLTSTNYTIEKIAELSGYGSNTCRFHEDFKKFSGTTPHKYKMQKLNEYNNLEKNNIIQ